MSFRKFPTSGVGMEIDDGGLVDYLNSVQKMLSPGGPGDRELLKRVGPIMRRSFAEQFAQGGDPDEWAPLEESTLQRRARRRYGRGGTPLTAGGRFPRRLAQAGADEYGGTLVDEGILLDSYVRSGARGHIERMYPDGTMEFGSSIPYAGLQQMGFRTRGGAEVPARPLVMRDQDIDAIQSVTSNYLGEILGASIGGTTGL